MEICQHCGMYMKPFITMGAEVRLERVAFCEFCGKVIARVVDRKWVKEPVKAL